MNYARALALRHRALEDCRAARGELDAAATDALRVYQARPLPVLAAAAGAGLVLSQVRVGRGFMYGAIRIASGPGWRFVRQLLHGAV